MALADFAKRLPEWQKQVLEQLASLIGEAAPNVTSTIKWAQPVFEHNGPLAFVKPAKKHVTFGFWRGSELSDPHGLLQGAGSRMKHLKLAKEDAIPITLLQRLVAEAVRLNEKHGDPTRKR